MTSALRIIFLRTFIRGQCSLGRAVVVHLTLALNYAATVSFQAVPCDTPPSEGLWSALAAADRFPQRWPGSPGASSELRISGGPGVLLVLMDGQ